MENGLHFELDGAGALVEPQSASRQVVNFDDSQENRLDFSHLDPVPDVSNDPSYMPSSRSQQMAANKDGLRRFTRLRKPSQAYIESLASRSFFDTNVLQFLADSPDVLLNLFSAATSKWPFDIGTCTIPKTRTD